MLDHSIAPQPTCDFGDKTADIRLYIANAPKIDLCKDGHSLRAISPNEITNIVSLTGNHWRKIFNIYAKLLYQLDSQHFDSWQDLRERQLLQQGSRQQLFCAHKKLQPYAKLEIVCGKQYARQLIDDAQLNWLDNDFAQHKQRPLIVTPYFDYRQLSNTKIEYLSQLISISG
ncbi:hypothetical protein EDC56_0318 [Sinobacterium caligoides]|uniref:Uncharacterized protein n=1 Tax=Sinobacterium caligoides TaxID=933926 RepID=A0A3N2DZR9_9GAMM|nr:hypothetical protein [Sinobacterium caligoides]ROS04805.1 hypothetical protein EDC56_0318 [Sinobacterium caligoides]